MLTATKEVARFVAECKPGDIPHDVMDKACQGITDFIGVALAGCKEKPSRIIADYIRRMGGTRQASIIGYGLETSLYLAALANGVMGHALDYDDMAISIRKEQWLYF